MFCKLVSNSKTSKKGYSLSKQCCLKGEKKITATLFKYFYLLSLSLSLIELNYKEKRVYKTKNDGVFPFSRRDYLFTYHAQNGQIHEFTLDERAFSRSRLRLHSRIHAQKKVNSRIHDLKKGHSRVHADRWGSLIYVQLWQTEIIINRFSYS